MDADLVPRLARGGADLAIRVGDTSISWSELRCGVAATSRRLEGRGLVAVWAVPAVDTCVGVLAALAAGAAVLPINPKAGATELAHVVRDGAPDVLLAPAGDELPAALAGVAREQVVRGEHHAAGGAAADGVAGVELADGVARTESADGVAGDGRAQGAAGQSQPADPEAPAFVLYTSGTTGPPKGVVLSRRAVAANLDALASVWRWTGEDRVVHALPLFHVHGLVIGVLGALRRGGSVHHVGRFSPEAVRDGLRGGGTMVFGVPTMYHRLGVAAAEDPSVAEALGGARVLVSGSAPLRDRDFRQVERVTGRRIVERYGLSETLMLCANPVDDPRIGHVGPPVPGVDLRLVDGDGATIPEDDRESLGEVLARGPNLFSGYLNRPDATREAMPDGWFRTGDLAVWGEDRYLRIVGRKATDLIKTGGYRVGAGEVEQALLEHPAVAEAAVTGEPDEDLGERIVAWVVRADGREVDGAALADHVAAELTPHKRPRRVVFVDALPRNDMGKVLKARLGEAADSDLPREPDRAGGPGEADGPGRPRLS
jgi:malonyl-CoA/methylmalonyl-CoA synthetase